MKKLGLFVFIFLSSTVYGGSDYYLHDLIRLGELEQIKRLIRNKEVDINEKDAFQRTPLEHSLIIGEYRIAQCLMNKNRTDCICINKFSGDNLLITTIKSAYIKLRDCKEYEKESVRHNVSTIIRRLLEKGVSENLENKNQESFLSKFAEFKKLLNDPLWARIRKIKGIRWWL